MDRTPSARDRARDVFRDDSFAKYHLAQFDEPKRSTVHLARFAREVLGPTAEEPLAILDVACGAGANMSYLSEYFPAASWTGVDTAEDFLDVGRERLPSDRFRLLSADLFELDQVFKPDEFDVAFSIQTLSWLPDYESALIQMLSCAASWVFVTSLFSDSDFDAFTTVVDRTVPESERLEHFYNVYSLPRLEAFCERQGIREMRVQDFDIDIDIPKPKHGKMSTYTMPAADGRKLQLSGPLLLPWKFIALRLA